MDGGVILLDGCQYPHTLGAKKISADISNENERITNMTGQNDLYKLWGR